jgi:hypothetical protein
MSGWGELLSILGRVIMWWLTKDERNRAALVASINKRQEGWQNENGDIFGAGGSGFHAGG